ncbi:MAG: DNA adenine methylase [Cyclobacteriaceae bacterium]|nr:DNA adenine methylase [Cyclobacteriaceae bacterium]
MNYTVATDHEVQEAEKHHALKNVKRVNTPFGYFGSKNKIAIQLSHNLPPHSCWVEAFCGSAALTLSKRKSPIEVINDIDGEIINVFKQLRNNQDELCRAISLTPYAKDELELARVTSKTDSDLERARKFLVQAMMAVNGVFGEEKGGFSYSQSYSRNGRDARVNRWYNLPERLTNVVERLRDVRIDNRDATELLEMFVNRPASLVYLDPPYLADRTKGYTNDANTDEFHIKLLKVAMRAKCMIFISGYENELYGSLLTTKKGWIKRIIETRTKDSKGKDHMREEVIWMNSQFKMGLKSKSLLVRLTKKELKENKLNPERK